jgi:hypothetical protein
MSSMNPLDILMAGRREAEVMIKGQRWRVREPDPLRSSQVIVMLTGLLGDWLTKILSGSVLRLQPARCPKGHEGEAEAINGRRWLCQHVTENVPCREIWAQEYERDEQGRPVAIDLRFALDNPDMRARLAVEALSALERVDPRELVDWYRLALVDAVDVHVGAALGTWLAVKDLSTLAARAGSGVVLLRLLRAAAEAWILPSLVDDWTDTSPASPTTETDGGSEALPSTPTPPVSATRAPPRTRRQG